MDLGEFSECEFLEEVEVDAGGVSGGFRGELKLTGICRMPAACNVVNVKPHPHGAGTFFKPEFGWLIKVMGPEGFLYICSKELMTHK